MSITPLLVFFGRVAITNIVKCEIKILLNFRCDVNILILDYISFIYLVGVGLTYKESE